ncbi:MAG: FtsW/RodA/SpoVE family cell cycle protein [bacterium]
MKNTNQKYDSLLLLIVIIVLVLGVLMVYSASSFKAQELFKHSRYYLEKHILKVAVSIVVLIIAMVCDYHRWLNTSVPFLIGTFLILLYLLLGQHEMVRNSRRWLFIGSFQVQPSDFARIALIMFLSSSLGKEDSKIKSSQHSFLIYLGIIGLVAFPIVLQPDVGTASLTIFVALVLLFLGGEKIGRLLLFGFSAIPAFLLYITQAGYQKNRVTEFLASLKGEHLAWQTKQSLIALGNGGLLGLGLGEGKQKYHFLPDPFTDFIYAIVGEELGLIGSIGILVLFMIIIWRGFKIAHNAPDTQGILLASGIVISIAVYAFTNAGVVLNLLPTTGIPLPFISYGGSALIVNMLGVGILLNISAQIRQKRRLKPMGRSLVGGTYSNRYGFS